MSEAATAAPGSNAPAPGNGSPPGAPQEPAKGPAPKTTVIPSPKPAHPGRANDGRFLPKEGGLGVAPPAGAPPEQKEEWRFREKLKVYGKEEEVDLDREGVKREMQRLRALERKQLPEFQQNDARARRIIELAKSDPEGFLRELGQDPDQYARKRLAEAARLGAMTEEEKAYHQLQQENEQLKARDQQRLEAEAKQATAAKHERLVSGFKSKITPALAVLKEMGIPDDHDTLGALVQTIKVTLEPGVKLGDVTPEELARDTLKRMDGNAERYLSRLDVPALVRRLGPAKIQGILEHSLAEHDKEQAGAFAAPPRVEAPPAPRARTEIIDGAEVARRMRMLK